MEAFFWVALLLLAVLFRKLRPQFLTQIEIAFVRLSQKRKLSIFLVAALAASSRLAILTWVPIPEPSIHDEFSYILQSNTFASGRLTNPSHPMAVHFETMHVNQWPTYQSMYPPAQGMFMATGEAFFGHPWYGVLLSAVLLCAAVTWMLQGWMPAPWALLGGIFCLLRFSTFSYWVNSYFGGAVAALGGALFFGSLGRMREKASVSLSLIMAVGLLLLANSRPYEGLVTCFVGCCAVAFWLWKDSSPARQKFTTVVIPLSLVLAIGFASMFYYNWRGTGNGLLMPYQVNFERYRTTKLFLWQKMRPVPTYTHFVMRKFYVYSEFRDYLRAHNEGIWPFVQEKIEFYYHFFIFPALPLFLIGIREAVKNPRLRLLSASLVVALAGSLVIAYQPQGHYSAPATCLVIAVMLVGLRKLRTWQPGGLLYGESLARVAVLGVFAVLTYETVARVVELYPADLYMQGLGGITAERPRIARQLEGQPGKHLVLVRYSKDHNFNFEWVYNGADLDNSKVVWARDMGPLRNQEIVDYYRDRKVWLVYADAVVPTTYPYEIVKDALARSSRRSNNSLTQ